eukprot:1145792-Pelagomonas_calceolata.AAC.1
MPVSMQASGLLAQLIMSWKGLHVPQVLACVHLHASITEVTYGLCQHASQGASVCIFLPAHRKDNQQQRLQPRHAVLILIRLCAPAGTSQKRPTIVSTRTGTGSTSCRMGLKFWQASICSRCQGCCKGACTLQSSHDGTACVTFRLAGVRCLRSCATVNASASWAGVASPHRRVRCALHSNAVHA